MARQLDIRQRAALYQIFLLAGVCLAGWYFIANAVDNLLARRIASGFGFLWREAGFEIGESTLLSFSAADSYLKALTVGLLNTFRVALFAVVFSTVIGVAVGLARLSPNWLLAKLASAYVELLRNIPLVVQLFFWYAVITESFPAPAQALESAAGILFSVTAASPCRRSPRCCRSQSTILRLSGFNFSGGVVLSPEFTALFLGLALYTAAFIGEIVRAGILAVDRGQYEAAQSQGLSQAQLMRLIILPQALRLVVPPVTSQYLNCIKNSSLAVAIGYPDLVSIANTTINQTGQAIEGIAVIMLVYLTISLAISALMNRYNRRIALRGAKT